MLLFYKKIIMVKHELKTNGKFFQINAQVKLSLLNIIKEVFVSRHVVYPNN